MPDNPLPVPAPTGIVSGIVNWGVPLLAGAGGYFVGDIGLYNVIAEFVGDTFDDVGILGRADIIGSGAGGELLDLTAIITIIPYAIIIGIIWAVWGFVQKRSEGKGGKWGRVIVWALSAFFLGIIIRLLAHAVLPRKIAINGPQAFPI